MKKTNTFGHLFKTTSLATGAACALALCTAGPASAQEEGAAVEEEETIVVTGSRIRRSDTTTAAPVAVIDNQAITDRGFVQVGQALNETTTVSPSRPISPFDGSSSGFAEHYPALFGLGPGRTLTLVNGRRFVSSASSFGAGATNDSVVDTNIIPTGLLRRVEIVQGGGAAVYGSDAMGGVVNYLLRDDFEGFEVDLQYGISDYDDYPTENARLTWGANINDRGNIAVNFEWSSTEPLFPEDRPESARGRVTSANPLDTGPNDGIPSVAPVFDARFWEFNTAGVLFAPPDPTGASCGGFPFRCFITTNGVRFHQFAPGGIPAQFSADGQSLVAYDPGTFPSPGPSIPFAAGGEGFPFRDLAALYSGIERASFNVIGHYDITPAVRVSGELLFSELNAEDPRASIPSNTILNNPATGSGPIAISAANPFLSASARTAIINYLNSNPALFGPNSGTGWSFGAPIPVNLSKIWTDLIPSTTGNRHLETYRALLALEGDFTVGSRDFYWSVSGSWAGADGSTRTWGVWQAHYLNAINARQSGPSIVCGINADADPTNDDPNCAPINPFGIGNVSQAARDYVSAQFGQDFRNTQTDFLATLGGALFDLPGGAMEFSVAYEHREEEAKFTPTEATRLGIGRAGVPTVAQSGEYDTDEFSAELLVPIFGGDFTAPFVQSLELNGAYRIVDNSIAGEEDVWNIGLRWEVLDGFILRASRSRNFRAPNLAQLFAPVTVGLEAIGQDPCDADRINGGPNPAVRLANCQALFAANPGYGPLATFQDPAENFPIAMVTRGGNPNLSNEISETWTYGLVLQPAFAPGLTIVADRIEVELNDGLSFFTPQDFLATCFDSSPQPTDICAVTTRDAVGTVVASSALTFNAGSIVFEGETYNINYLLPIELGWLDGNLELNLEATHVSLLETSVTGVDLTRTDGTAAQPDWRARFDARWVQGPWRFVYTLNYLPEVLAVQGATIENNPNPTLDANYRHSISAQYEITEDVALRAGVENFTDEGPSFPSVSYGDILGRQYYVGLRARF